MTKRSETITLTDKTFSCNGGQGPLGHPQIYLTFTEKAEIDCPYCGRHFIYKTDKQQPTHIDGVETLGTQDH